MCVADGRHVLGATKLRAINVMDLVDTFLVLFFRDRIFVSIIVTVHFHCLLLFFFYPANLFEAFE